jgi:hypothetical protein
LKWDGFGPLQQTCWLWLTAPTAGSALVLLAVWCVIDFLSLAPPARGDTIVAAELDIESLLAAKPAAIERFHQAEVFRNALLAASYAVVIAFASINSQRVCDSCNTPYRMLSLGLVGCYSARLVALLFDSVRSWGHLRTLVTELAFEPVRVFETLAADLAESMRYSWWIYLDLLLFAATAAFAALGTIWVVNRACVSPVCLPWLH